MPQPRITLIQLAAAAGVSPATADRVLNNRPGVRPRTRDRVWEVARHLGYVDAAPLADPLRLTFLLPMGTNTFIDQLADQITAQAALRPDLAVMVERVPGFAPEPLAARLMTIDAQGVALIAPDHPLLRQAIKGLADRAIPVVTLATDILNTPRLAYVGIDNRQAGRLAGQLIGRFLPRAPAKVALFAGSLSYRGHEEREMGFRHILREDFPALNILDLREVLDDRARAAAETHALLDQHPDLAAIYNVGGGTSGIAAALQARGAGAHVVLISHEATPSNRALLLDGTVDAVLDQNPRVEAREALNLLTHAIRGQNYPFVPLRLQLILRENLPQD
jgi:LacI family transcriptional regulator